MFAVYYLAYAITALALSENLEYLIMYEDPHLLPSISKEITGQYDILTANKLESFANLREPFMNLMVLDEIYTVMTTLLTCVHQQ